MSEEPEAFGPPRPLEIIEREPTLHRSTMAVLMQGGSRPYSDVLVVHYLARRPDMRERVDAWRRAGAQVLAERRASWQAEARLQAQLKAQRKEAVRRAELRRLALSHLDGLTAQERYMFRLAQRLLAAAEQEPNHKKRVELVDEAYALLDD